MATFVYQLDVGQTSIPMTVSRLGHGGAKQKGGYHQNQCQGPLSGVREFVHSSFPDDAQICMTHLTVQITPLSLDTNQTCLDHVHFKGRNGLRDNGKGYE